MTKPLTLECEVHFQTRRKGKQSIHVGQAVGPACEPGRVPRIAKLMALAIRFDGLIRDGVVRDYAELSRLGRVSRARMTQIMNLLMLAPDIQEEILFLPRIEQGKDRLSLLKLQPLALTADWQKQRKRWHGLLHTLPDARAVRRVG